MGPAPSIPGHQVPSGFEIFCLFLVVQPFCQLVLLPVFYFSGAEWKSLGSCLTPGWTSLLREKMPISLMKMPLLQLLACLSEFLNLRGALELSVLWAVLLGLAWKEPRLQPGRL